MKNGVPYHEATEVMSEAEVLAHAVAFSEMEGGRFNWDTLEMERPDA